MGSSSGERARGPHCGTRRFRGYAAICQDTTTAKEDERLLERQNICLKECKSILANDLQNPLNGIEGHLDR